MTRVDQLAANFIALVRSKTKEEWVTFSDINQIDIGIIRDFLDVADQISDNLSIGRVRDSISIHMMDEDDLSSTYAVNTVSPFLVCVDLSAGTYRCEQECESIRWLDVMLKTVLEHKQNIDTLIQLLVQKVISSQHMPPIIVNEYGEAFTEGKDIYGGSNLFSRLKDSDRIGQNLKKLNHGHHSDIGFLRGGSKTHDVLFCKECGLRVPYPTEIKTFGELRSYLRERIS